MAEIIDTPVKMPVATPSTSPSGGGKQSGSEAGYPSRSQSSHAPKEVIYDNGVLNKS